MRIYCGKCDDILHSTKLDTYLLFSFSVYTDVLDVYPLYLASLFEVRLDP